MALMPDLTYHSTKVKLIDLLQCHFMGKLLLSFCRHYTPRAREPLADLNVTKLSATEVSELLRSREQNYTVDGKEKCAIKGYSSNQLPANEPVEDTRAEVKFIHSDGMAFGIFDGHGGPSCARVLAKHLLRYIAVPLLPPKALLRYIKENDGTFKLVDFLTTTPEKKEVRIDVFDKNLLDWANCLDYMSNQRFGVPAALKKAFERLDKDIGFAVEGSDKIEHLMSVAISGAVACVAAISDVQLSVAFAGDCQAVLGRQTNPNGPFEAKKLTFEHTYENTIEVEKLKKEHPPSEHSNIIQDGRLFRSLAPLRSFGDYRYKWTVDKLEKFAVPTFGKDIVPPNYFTPPYLTAIPDVNSITLTEKDKFLVLATDGLWESLSPEMVVQLVADHMEGKVSLINLQMHKFKDLYPGKAVPQEIEPIDEGGSTHLIRTALGGSNEIVAKQLSFPAEHVRLIRDDITVTVIYFDTEYLKMKSPISNDEETNNDSMFNAVPPKLEFPELVKKSNENIKKELTKELFTPSLNTNKTTLNKSEAPVIAEDTKPKPAKAKPHKTEAPEVEEPKIEAVETEKNNVVESRDERVLSKQSLIKGRWEEIELNEKSTDIDLDKAIAKGGMKFKETVYSKGELKLKKDNFLIDKNENNQQQFRTLQLKSLKPSSVKFIKPTTPKTKRSTENSRIPKKKNDKNFDKE